MWLIESTQRIALIETSIPSLSYFLDFIMEGATAIYKRQKIIRFFSKYLIQGKISLKIVPMLENGKVGIILTLRKKRSVFLSKAIIIITHLQWKAVIYTCEKKLVLNKQITFPCYTSKVLRREDKSTKKLPSCF